VQTLPQILQTFEGEIRFVLRDFPVHGDPAVKMAEASQCANDQGKFWEYHDNLWETYDTNVQQAADMEALVGTLKGYASDLGLDTAVFDECLDSDKYASEVQKDAQDAVSYGVGGTPAFFVNGRLVAGAIPFEDYTTQQGPADGFQTIINAALEEAGAS